MCKVIEEGVEGSNGRGNFETLANASAGGPHPGCSPHAAPASRPHVALTYIYIYIYIYI